MQKFLEYLDSLPCILCGQPGDQHDDEVCQTKMDAWEPVGILNADGVATVQLSVRPGAARLGMPDPPGNPYLGPHV